MARTWEEYIQIGMDTRASKDGTQWTLGDLALEVTSVYGKDSLGKFAWAIKVEKKTLLNYRTTAKKFNMVVRTKYPRLSFSHFATLSAVDKPEAWLEKAEDEDWNVEHLRSSIREAYPGNRQPDIGEIPEVYKCSTCGHWRIKDVSTYEVCRGHYEVTKDGLIYK